MAKAEVRCPVCGTSFVVGNSGNAVTELNDGIHFLVPETVRNENVTKSSRVDLRLNALKDSGINVDKLQALMQSNDDLKSIFDSDDPIIAEISKGGFIRNPELFRRWITAQTFRLLDDPNGWTHAVRRRYDAKYVVDMTKRELGIRIELERKCPKDVRNKFFTLWDFKRIFEEMITYNEAIYKLDDKREMEQLINSAESLGDLSNIVNNCIRWRFKWNCSFKPKTWLNCFKGAGAYYTLQNIIRTHGLVLPKCKDMNESLEWVDNVFKSIIGYEPRDRRWDILMSVLVSAVKETGFELKY